MTFFSKTTDLGPLAVLLKQFKGIFVSPTGIILNSGSIGSSLIIWVIAGLIATVCALCYIELGLIVHESGGEYSYCYKGYGGLIGFLTGWTLVIMAKPAG